MLKNELAESEYKDKAFSDHYLLQIIETMKPRVTFLKEFINNCTYFYEAPISYDKDVVKKRWNEDSAEHLITLRNNFAKLPNPSKEDYEKALTDTAEQLNTGKGKLIHPLRLAVSGTGTGPGMYDLLFILGKDESVKRIDRAIENIN